MPITLEVNLDQAPTARDLSVIEEVLGAGELIILPTDTVYGVGADPRIEGSTARIYAAKERPSDKPLPMLAGSVEAIEKHSGSRLSEEANMLAERYWPGALTMVLPAGTSTVGYRIPDCRYTRELLERLDGPLEVTSANRSGEPETLTAQDALSSLAGPVGLVIDGGTSPGGTASTVISVLEGNVELLREGVIPFDQIMSHLQRQP